MKKILIILISFGMIWQFSFSQIEKAFAAENSQEGSNVSAEILPAEEVSENQPQNPELTLPEVKNVEPAPVLPIVNNVVVEEPKNSVNNTATGSIVNNDLNEAAASWTGDIEINSNDKYTNDKTVTITNNVQVNGKTPKKMKISNDSDLSSVSWETYSAAKVWDLDDSTDGKKTIYMKFKRNDKVSEKFKDSIILDTIKPEVLAAKTAFSDIINLTFSEDIKQCDSTKIILTGYTAIDCTIGSDKTIGSIKLDKSLGRNDVPNITFEKGALKDLAKNKNKHQEFTDTQDGIAPAIPNVNIVSGAGFVGLSWYPVDGADHYEIYRNPTPRTPYYILNSSYSDFNDLEVTIGENYSYWVRAIDASGNSSDDSIHLPAKPYAIYAPIILGAQTQEETQPKIASAVVNTESVQETEQLPSEENGDVEGNKTTEEAASTNWPLIIGIILAALVILFWIYYWYVSWKESQSKNKSKK